MRDRHPIGAPADPDVHRATDLEHVATVERPLLDRPDLESQPARRLLGAERFAAPDLLPGSRDDGEIVEDHERVLHEHRIGTLVGRFDLGDIPTGRGHRFHVRIPLATGEGDVDGLSFDVRDDPLVERRTRTADEGERARHEPVRSVLTSGSSNNADASRSWQS